MPAPAGQEAPKRQYPADSRVQPAFVDDLAGHVLERFQGSGLDVSLPSLNQRYGVRLTGLAGGSRAAVLRYAFHPDMLRSLYTIYADRFLDSLDRQCAERHWSDLQKRQLHMALAGRLNAWAAALDGVAAVPDLNARLAESERLLQESLDIYSRMASTVFELDEARQRNDAAAIATAQLRVDDITARYRQAMDARAAAQHALVGDIRRHAGAALDDDTPAVRGPVGGPPPAAGRQGPGRCPCRFRGAAGHGRALYPDRQRQGGGGTARGPCRQ